MKVPELVATTSFIFDPSDPMEGTDYMGLDLVAFVGVADIYEAVHRERRTVVSVKLLRKELVGHVGAEASLRLEAALLANLQHPGIVEATACDRTPSGRPYLVTERLVGRSLFEEVRRSGPMSPSDVVDVGRQILSALAAVHQRGIVHRSIGLETIFLTTNQTTKLVDFTRAKVTDPPALTFPFLATTTPTGFELRAAGIVSPEEVAGNPVDARSDLFAVGAILHALLCGRGPVPRVGANGVPSARIEAILPGSELGDVIQRALAANPNDRFGSAVDFYDALGRAYPPSSGVRRLEFLPTEPSVPPFAHMESLIAEDMTSTIQTPLLPPFSPEQFRPQIPSATLRRMAALHPSNRDVASAELTPSPPARSALTRSLGAKKLEPRNVALAVIAMLCCASLTALLLSAVR